MFLVVAEMSSPILEDVREDGSPTNLTNSQRAQQAEAAKRRSRVNWTENELLVLQNARRDDMQSYALGGTKKKHKTGAQRWKAITEACVNAGVTRTTTQCKDKWESTHAEWKRIYDYENDTPSGCASYWHLTNKQRKAQRLPSSFFSSVYESMLTWCAQSTTIDPEENLMETTNVAQPGATSKSTPTTSDQDEEYELYGDQANIQNDASTPPAKRIRDDRSNDLPISKRRKTKQTKSLQGLLQMLEKNNELLVSVMSTSEQKKDARHQEVLQFEREKFLEQSELDKSKLELSKQLGLGYISALQSIGENIKLLGESIIQSSKDLD